MVGCSQVPSQRAYLNTIKVAAKHQNHGEFVLAENYHQKVLNEMWEGSSVSPDWLVIQMNNLASAKNLNNKSDEARVLLTQAYEILSTKEQSDDGDIVLIESNLARTEELLENYERSELLYRSSLERKLKIEDARLSFIAADLAGIARMLARKNKMDEAMGFHLKAKDMYAKSLGVNSLQWQRRVKLFEAIMNTQGNNK